MSHKKDFDELRTQKMLDRVQYKTSTQLGDEDQRKVEVSEERLGLEGNRKPDKNVEVDF